MRSGAKRTLSRETDGCVLLTSGTDRAQIRSVLFRACAAVVVLSAALVLALNRPAARSAFVIGLLSVSLAYLIMPLTERLCGFGPIGGRRLTAVPAVLAIYFLGFALGFSLWLAAGGQLQGQVSNLRPKIPEYADRARQQIEIVDRIIERLIPSELVTAQTHRAFLSLSASIRTQATQAYEEVAAGRVLLPWLWLVPAIALLLISRVSWFRRSAVARLPEGHLRWRGEEFFLQVNSVLAGYTRAQVLSGFFVGFVSVAGFWLIGLPHPFLLGIASGILEFLPVVGPLILALIACTMADGVRLLEVIGFLAALRVVQDYLVYPRLAGRGMHLHPLAIIIAILAGSQAGGMIGVLAAIPFVGIASVAVRHWREYWQIERIVREHGGSPATGRSSSVPPPEPVLSADNDTEGSSICE
jgi:predicted PurR-regulated permease PerM